MHQVHIFVSGRVHGVFFRASTKGFADDLAISGWVKNLKDGRVEIVAQGERSKLEQLLEWCRKGPRMASVTSVEHEFEDIEEEYEGFKIVR